MNLAYLLGCWDELASVQWKESEMGLRKDTDVHTEDIVAVI